MLALSLKADPTQAPSPFYFGFVGWIIAVLTKQPGMYVPQYHYLSTAALVLPLPV